MKKIIITSSFIFIIISAFSQSPCSWFSNPTPDSLTLDSSRMTFNVHKLRVDQPTPEFDGQIDKLWNEFGFESINKVAISDPGQNISARTSWCYNADWLYLIIIISGDDTIDVTGAASSSDLIQLTYQKVFGGAGNDSSHYNHADWRKWLWKKDGDRKWIMPSDKVNNNYQWLDQDISNNGTGTCSEIVGDVWLTLDVTTQIKYAVNVSPDSIVFEMAFGWKNFLYLDSMPPLNYEFGFDISYKDYENDKKVGQINLNDPGNNAWAYAPAMAKFVIADTLPTPPPTNYTENIKNQIDIYPNPASEQVHIILPQNDNFTLSVFDITGRQTHRIMIPANTSIYILETQNYTPGVYSIILSNEKHMYNSKIIIR